MTAAARTGADAIEAVVVDGAGEAVPAAAGQRHAALLAACVGAFLNPFMTNAVNVALPPIGQEFGLNAVLLGWVSTSYLLGSVVFLVPFARAADIYGRKRIFLIGVASYTGASLLCAAAPSATLLLVFRIAQGIAAAMIWSNGVAMLMSVYPPAERGRALGITVACVYLGLGVGPFLGGILTEHLGWRTIFLVNVPFGLGATWLTLRLRGEWTGSPGERLDLAGSAVYGGAAVVLMYGFSVLPDPRGAWLTLAGLAGLAAFVHLEAGMDMPVMDVRLFRANRTFALSNVAALLHYTSTYGIPFMLSLYLQYVKGLTPGAAGAILLAQPMMQAVFSPFAGRLSDRIEPRILSSVGLALTATGLVLLSAAGERTATAFIVIALMIAGMGFGVFSSPNTNAVMSSVAPRSYGMASGILSTMRLAGQTLSMVTVMLVINLFVGRVQITPERHVAFLLSNRIAFLAFAVYCLGGILASLSRGDVREKAPV